MKSYLITSGLIFALFAALYVWRIIVEWHGLGVGVWALAGSAVLLAGLAVWSWRLLATLSRKP